MISIGINDGHHHTVSISVMNDKTAWSWAVFDVFKVDHPVVIGAFYESALFILLTVGVILGSFANNPVGQMTDGSMPTCGFL